MKKAVIIFMVIGLALSGCSKEKTKEEKPKSLPSAVNPYSPTGVFYQVRQKLKKDPNNPQLLYHLADLYERAEVYDKEVETLKKVVKLKPDMGYAYCKMGTALNRLERYEEAVDAFKECIKRLPKYPVAYNNLAYAYGKLGKLDKQIDALEKAVQLRPNYATGRLNLGLVYLKAGRIQDAKKQYDALKEIHAAFADKLLQEIKKKGGA